MRQPSAPRGSSSGWCLHPQIVRFRATNHYSVQQPIAPRGRVVLAGVGRLPPHSTSSGPFQSGSVYLSSRLSLRSSSLASISISSSTSLPSSLRSACTGKHAREREARSCCGGEAAAALWDQRCGRGCCVRWLTRLWSSAALRQIGRPVWRVARNRGKVAGGGGAAAPPVQAIACLSSPRPRSRS